MSIAENLQKVQQQIRLAEKKYQRDKDSVSLLAVSKTHTADKIVEAVAVGQRDFGENYLQEALEKISALAELNLQWHFIGAIQANKTRAIAENFSWVHSVSREKIAERLHLQRPTNLPPLNICIQINLNEEKSKSGLLLEDIEGFIETLAPLNRLRVRGLMVIPEKIDAFDKQLENYQRVTDCFDQLNKAGFSLDVLSMGMSQDLSAAIAAGSTMVRVGTAIFGARGL